MFTGVQALVREVFKETLKIEQDEDIVSHQVALKEDIERYHEGHGNGPDPDNLRLDLKGEANSGWNSKVVQILRGKLEPKTRYYELPTRSDRYLDDIIQAKFKRLRICWRQVQVRINEAGRLETPDELENRVQAKKDATLKSARHNTRRHSVSW
jgi:hypothetical protein